MISKQAEIIFDDMIKIIKHNGFYTSVHNADSAYIYKTSKRNNWFAFIMLIERKEGPAFKVHPDSSYNSNTKEWAQIIKLFVPTSIPCDGDVSYGNWQTIESLSVLLANPHAQKEVLEFIKNLSKFKLNNYVRE